MPDRYLSLDCANGRRLHPIDAAYDEIVAFASCVDEKQTIPVTSAVGRVLGGNIRTEIPLPRFDHSAVDGFGITEFDLNHPSPLNLSVAARLAAGELTGSQLEAGSTFRLFTGAQIPLGVVAVVPEERCQLEGSAVTVAALVTRGANIRRSGEDVQKGSIIVEGGTILDGRHIAILIAAGISEVDVRRRVRVAVLSNGTELREPGVHLEAGQIPDANRPMLMAMLASRWIEVIDFGCCPDDLRALGRTFSDAAKRADVIVSSGGVSGSDADHVPEAVTVAGGSLHRFRLALKPGKPILAGRIGQAAVLGLPGNSFAAMVNFLLFGRALIGVTAGLSAQRPRGQIAIASMPFAHSPGRTEFVPAKIVGFDQRGLARLEKLGRGGSARLRPLVLADGLVEIPADCGNVPAGSLVAYHAFHAAFSP